MKKVFDVRDYMYSEEAFSGEDIIRAMFNLCDDEGKIIVRNISSDSIEIIPHSTSWYHIDWAGGLPAEAIEKFRACFETLKEGHVPAEALLENPEASEFISHCGRYLQLCDLPAPEVVMRGEEQRMAVAFVLSHFGEEIEEIK